MPHRQTWPSENSPNSKFFFTKTSMALTWGYLLAIPTTISQKPRISFFPKTPYQAIWLSRAITTNLSKCKTH